MVSVASEHRYPAPDIGVYIQPVHQGVACHCEFILPFDRKKRAEMLRIKNLIFGLKSCCVISTPLDRLNLT